VSSSGDDVPDADGSGGADADESDDCDDGEWWQRSDPEPPSIGPDAPEVEIPEVEIPEVDIPGAGEPAEVGEVDADTAKGFWRLVLVFDVALLALALGPMFVYFRGDMRRGGMLVAFGVVVFLYGVARYREFRAEGENRDDAAEGGGDGNEA
jgi:hypothetical protein